MKEIDKLDSILLSDNVYENFYTAWQEDKNFNDYINSVLPEIADCEKQVQRNPWHKYNVLGHILHSVDAMNKQTKDMDPLTRRRLAYTMLLHDIGKPKHHIERMKDGETIDSFFNHNVGSEKVARRVLPTLGFDDNETNIICKLVYKHDIFMFIRDFPTDNPHWRTLNTKLIQDEINDLETYGNGKELLLQLIMIGRADNLAQNELMTKNSLELLNKMQNMTENM